jgi:hypothetical protein
MAVKKHMDRKSKLLIVTLHGCKVTYGQKK